MNRIAAGVIALVLAILLASCHPGVIACFAGEWGNRLCSADPLYNNVYVESNGQIIQEYTDKHKRAPGQYPVVPGNYLVTLAADADAKPIIDIYGQFRIHDIRYFGRIARGRYRYSLYLVRLSEDPGPARILELQRENTQIFSVTPSFGNLRPSQIVEFRQPPKSD